MKGYKAFKLHKEKLVGAYVASTCNDYTTYEPGVLYSNNEYYWCRSKKAMYDMIKTWKQLHIWSRGTYVVYEIEVSGIIAHSISSDCSSKNMQLIKEIDRFTV